MDKPLVSVLLCVYNGEKYLREAMDSIIFQTYPNWECIVIDDCSVDGTNDILREYAKKDRRIRLYRNEKNSKLPQSLNRALELASGRYVLRMDADDVCRKDRFEKQVEFMETHPEISMSCCKIAVFRENEWELAARTRRDDQDAVKALFLFFNPIYHNAVIAKAGDMKRLRYNPAFSCTEDLELWTRMAGGNLNIAVQNEYMVLYRLHREQTSVVHSAKQKEQYQQIIKEFYKNNMYSLDENELHFLTEGVYYRNNPDILRFTEMVKKIRRINRTRNVFSDEGIRYAAFEIMMACRGRFSIREWTAGILSLGPVFAVHEIFRRKWCKYKNRNIYRRAEEWLQQR